jgi:hypothetical protein
MTTGAGDGGNGYGAPGAAPVVTNLIDPHRAADPFLPARG